MSIATGVTGGASNPLGKVDSLNLDITDVVTDLSQLAKYMPWISFSLFNDGPDAIYISVNEDVADMDTPINKGEPFQADMGKRKIDKVLIVCAAGGHSSVRLYAKA